MPQKKKRKLPKDIVHKSDDEALEKIFGKRVKRELDKTVQESEKKGVSDSMQK